MIIDKPQILGEAEGLVASASYAARVGVVIEEPITISATTTNPTKATNPTQDIIALTDNGSGWCQIDLLYSHINNTGASDGSGTFLFSLPGGYEFDTTVHPLNTQLGLMSGGQELHKAIIGYGWVQRDAANSGNWHAAVPHNSTQFKIMTDAPTAYGFIADNYYGLAGTWMNFKLSFRFKKA